MNKFNVNIGDVVMSNTTMLTVVGFCEYSDRHVYAESNDGYVALVLKSNLKLVSRGNNP